jgi:putative PEP-CTERM system TPR-repeat lipoprotein
MIEKDTERDIPRTDAEGPVGEYPVRRVLCILCLVIVAIGGAAAWYFELGVSSQTKRERFVKSARESLSRNQLREAVTALLNAVDADPSSAEAFHELGMAYLRAGNYGHAFREFRRAVQLKPDLIPPRFQMARLLASDLALTQADEHLIKIRELNPNAIEGVLLAAEIALAEGNLDRALNVLRAAIARQPNETIFHLNSAAIFMAKQDYKSAEDSYKKALDLDPKSNLARAALAAVFLAQGNQEKAEQQLLAMTKAEPENDELLRILGNFYTRTWQLDQLEKLYRNLLAKRPDSLVARKILAELSLSKGDLQQAREFTEAILKAEPNDVEGRFFKARLFIAEKNYKMASQLLTGVTLDSPNHTPAHYLLGIANLEMGEKDIARRALTKATELNPRWIPPRLELASLYLVNGENRLAWKESQKVLELEPDNRGALYTAAGAQFKNGDYDSALEIFSRMQKSYPKDPAVHIGLGGVYMAQSRYALALKEYEEALRLDPNRMDGLNLIAQLMVKEGKPQEALERVKRHFDKAQDHAGIFQILGEISASAGDVKKGIGYLEKGLAINPNLVSAYLKMGDLYAGQQDFDQAIAAYLKAVERTPRAIEPRMRVAMMYERKKQYAKANEFYEEILDINQNFVPAANNLAWNSAEHGGNIDVALRWAQKARENDPQNPNVADTIGWIYYKLGMFAKAINRLQESTERLGNNNPNVLYHLGMAYYRVGKRAEAREALIKALALSRNFNGADEAIKTLAVLGSS